MSERTSYRNGVPLWVDVATPDIDASAAFYCGLFGWEFGGAHPEIPYGMFLLDGKLVAASGALQDANQPPVGPRTSPPTMPTRRSPPPSRPARRSRCPRWTSSTPAGWPC